MIATHGRPERVAQVRDKHVFELRGPENPMSHVLRSEQLPPQPSAITRHASSQVVQLQHFVREIGCAFGQPRAAARGPSGKSRP
jgi:hypothetical protein